MRLYFFTAFLSMLIYPLVWYSASPESFYILFKVSTMGAFATVAITISAPLSLKIFSGLAKKVPAQTQVFALQIGSAVVAGLLTGTAIYLRVVYQTGFWQSFTWSWVQTVTVPAAMTALVAYWLVGLLVTPLIILLKH